ncbi:hypothetical protein CY658_10990 [Variovorax sp. RO1]|uniref:hypothetical protein n=1 Tax=Variovorax sp. RO1 TaxID=2066034 RepID=UPI000CBB4EEF|nr:hypothetical protein [Variovorax sp. RO1]PLC07469.1 hypothetical protein CY658_10990 [Variovorax sp. RO1]
MQIATPTDVSLELSELGHILKNLGIILDDKPIQDSAQQVLGSRSGLWYYQIDQLLIEVGGKGLKYFPTHASGTTQCRLDMTVEGYETRVNDDDDPLKHNGVQIFLSSSVGAKKYNAAWHFDAQGARGTSHYLHPRYHMTFGGLQLFPQLSVDNGQHQMRNLLLLDSPRFSHPPLDLVLAVDFILSHFAGPKWASARQSADYVQHLKRSQERLWKPYFSSAAKICAGAPHAWGPSPWPQLV